MHKLRIFLAQPSLDKDLLLSLSHCASAPFAWRLNGTGFPDSPHPSRQGWEANCQLCSLGLVCCGRQEDFSLATRFINRRLFWKSNRDARQELESQQSAKTTCYFQMAYGHPPTKHVISCAQVGVRLPANSKFSLPRKPKTAQSYWQPHHYEYLPHISWE